MKISLKDQVRGVKEVLIIDLQEEVLDEMKYRTFIILKYK